MNMANGIYAALCGLNKGTPQGEWQSPEILKLIEREEFIREAEDFKATHRNFFVLTLCPPAAEQIKEHLTTHPARPLRVEHFIFDNGQAFAKNDYSGA